jgi:hypothetical protein
MSSTTLVKKEQLPTVNIAGALEQVVMYGNLRDLPPKDRIEYYKQICHSLGLNPLTRPLEYVTLNGKLQLYARKDCCEQLRKLHGVSIYKIETREAEGIFEALAYGRIGEREDVEMGATSIKGLAGDNLVNARLKAITKAKRRLTLSICGLGFLDETEIETIPGAAIEIQGSGAEAVSEDAGASTVAVPRQGDAPALVSDEDRAIEEEHMRLHARLLEEIRTLRDLGIPYNAIQGQLRLVTGEEERKNLTDEQLEKAITSFSEWSRELAQKIRDNK